MDLHPVAVAQGAPSAAHGIQDDVHPLLLDAERGDLGEAVGLDAPHAALERALAAESDP